MAAITLTPAAPVHGPLGITLTVGAAVTNDTLTITSTPAELSALPEPVRTLAATAIGAPLPLPAFPFNVHLTAGTLDADGLHLTAVAANSVFPTR